ncbi:MULTISPECIES: pyrimidine 5'-nucleotidase [Kordiimonas]|jgi:putative hydrolase of the HAD superfamily|uniref:Putative hydrolase of the HAD superfamily n=1 Tax=Kordiimonas lacus TaxID=637679 RepID=A0A1G6XM26_9PROT|nr:MULTISPECIES: pyrimidine 5'-nucleotidase [Kordiimonas]SDD79274.1 putative hydrolase of the HAD superfamily [Kordiimonas lacus]
MLDFKKQSFHPTFDDPRDVWVFDLDNTLYAAECNLFSQIDQKIGEYVQTLLGLSPEEARKVQKHYLLEHGTTLKGLMAHHSVDPYHYLDSVHDIDFAPIERDDHLRNAIERLEGRKVVFTNADEKYAAQVLKRLGIDDQFEDIFDIHEAALEPKPKPEVYDKFVGKYGIDPKRAVMFEDMARNLVPAHAMGMATVWINTGSIWGQADHDPETVHAETDNLATWLHAFLNR